MGVITLELGRKDLAGKKGSQSAHLGTCYRWEFMLIQPRNVAAKGCPGRGSSGKVSRECGGGRDLCSIFVLGEVSTLFNEGVNGQLTVAYKII